MDAWLYDPEMPVGTIMRMWPGTIRVFLDHRMDCIGCPISRFHTVTEVARLYGMEEEQLVARLAAAAEGTE